MSERSAPCLAWAVWLSLCAAAPPMARADQSLAPQQVAEAIVLRRSRVAELRLIKEAAEELGVRVWLFGGTAAGFAHYVRSDLAREAGDPRYRESFFDYDFTNIYRSTQDADLVVDGTPEQAEGLEALIRQKMSFLQGSKEHWEVRLLRQDRQAPRGQLKQALLANPDFLEQNTDSNSTGMIELTDPPPGENVVRDLRDWKNPVPFFLQDVTEGRLHYYLSPSHERTSRYLSGDNPPLFSVIRYLVKAFQYDLQVEGEDLAKVQAIIDAFDPRRDYPALSPWARGWLERYGPNLIRHSVNVEYAWETMERLGLRKKLISLSNPSRQGTLGWWLSREPLRTSPVGRGEGRTAAELGIEVVAHETSDFLAYESITRDTTLRPNVLISRPDSPGEVAAFGPGFYTRLGRSGAAGTGLTIRFRVDPRAREGTDFTVHRDFALFTNRAALQVIPESLQATWPQYFEMLQQGVIDPSDRGAWMKLKRRLSLQPMSAPDEERIAAMVGQEIEGLPRTDGPSAVIQEWFALPASRRHPELVEKIRAGVPAEIDRILGAGERPPPGLERRWGSWRSLLLEAWFALPESRAHPELVTRLREALGQALDRAAPGPAEINPMVATIDYHPAVPLANAWFDLPGSREDLAPLWRLMDLSAPTYYTRTRNYDRWWGNAVLENVLQQPGWPDHPEVIRALLDRGSFMTAAYNLMVRDSGGLAPWEGHPELMLELIDRVPIGSLHWHLQSLITHSPHFWKSPEPLRRMIARADPDGTPNSYAFNTVGSFRQWVAGWLTQKDDRHGDNPELILALLEWMDSDPPGTDREDRWLEKALQPEFRSTYPPGTTRDQWLDAILAEEKWRQQPRLRELCGGSDPHAACLREGLRRESAARAAQVTEEAARLPHASDPTPGCP